MGTAKKRGSRQKARSAGQWMRWWCQAMQRMNGTEEAEVMRWGWGGWDERSLEGVDLHLRGASLPPPIATSSSPSLLSPADCHHHSLHSSSVLASHIHCSSSFPVPMFKKKRPAPSTSTASADTSSSASAEGRRIRRPGQALEDLKTEGGRSKPPQTKIDGIDDSPSPPSSPSSPSTSSVVRPSKRSRPVVGGEETSSASSPSLLDPTLITVASDRSSLPDLTSHSHRFALFAPKNDATPPPSTSTAVLPPLPSSTTFSVSRRFGPQKANGYARVISRFDYQPDVCVAAGTPVALADGCSKAIEEVVAGDVVLSFDRSRNGLVPLPVSSNAKCNGVQDCIELRLSDGLVLTVTPDHLILTDAQQWVRAGDLVIGQSHVSVKAKADTSAAAQSAEHPTVCRKVHYGVGAGAGALPMFGARLLMTRKVGPRLVYDLSVPQVQQSDRSFVAAGVVVHNCKDWMECGSCGYGDSCKFLHDRLDYKQGWQLDKEWEEAEKKKEEREREALQRRERGETVVDPTLSSKPQLPFACYICRQPFTAPVVTACGHYFDEKCALLRFAKINSRCAICGKETHGSFTTAQELLQPSKTAQGKGAKVEDEVEDEEEQPQLDSGQGVNGRSFSVR